jgi:hypothetical protein
MQNFQDWLRRRAQLPHLSLKKKKKKKKKKEKKVCCFKDFQSSERNLRIFMFSDMFGMIYRSTPLLNTWSANTTTTYSIAQF